MPTYEYECQQCHERVEAVQKFTDPSLTVCPLCGGELRKVFSAVGIVFKGSGFYKNDSRGSAPKTTTTPSTSTPVESSAAASSSTPATTPTPASTPTTPAPTPSSN
ncbi:MAG TPA: FmdB family zinc ribbon protein [Acidimicrobiales bacterium]|jgi:putative FmdB family regulatory protein|nr:FmdB family zinc ribbon protein [Acidimicrobiales bacterium]